MTEKQKHISNRAYQV